MADTWLKLPEREVPAYTADVENIVRQQLHALQGIASPTSKVPFKFKTYDGSDWQLEVQGQGANSSRFRSHNGTYGFDLTDSGLSLLGPSISGFTAGSVMFAGPSGLISQDAANFFWDDTNNRLGLGTNAPNNQLHLTGNAQIMGRLGIVAAPHATIPFFVNGAGRIAGDFDVATTKFTVASATGNTTVAGTFVVTGATQLNTGVQVLGGNLTVGTGPFFSVDYTNGNIAASGTFVLTGPATLNGAVTLGDTSADAIHIIGVLTVDNSATFIGDMVFGNAAGDTISVVGTPTFLTNVFFNGSVTLGDAAGDTITATGAFVASNGATLNGTVSIVTNGTVGGYLDSAGLRATGTSVPGTGTGIELGYNSGANIGYVIAFNRTGSAYKDLAFYGLSVDLSPSGTSKLKVDPTGVGFYATVPVAQPAAAAAATDLATAITLVNSLRTGLRAATGVGLFS